MPDTRPDMRQRASFVTSNAACRWNKMLLAELKVDIPRAAIVIVTDRRPQSPSARTEVENLRLSTGHDERPDAIHQVWRSGRVITRSPHLVDCYNSCTLFPASWTIAAYLENFPAHMMKAGLLAILF